MRGLEAPLAAAQGVDGGLPCEPQPVLAGRLVCDSPLSCGFPFSSLLPHFWVHLLWGVYVYALLLQGDVSRAP